MWVRLQQRGLKVACSLYQVITPNGKKNESSWTKQVQVKRGFSVHRKHPCTPHHTWLLWTEALLQWEESPLSSAPLPFSTVCLLPRCSLTEGTHSVRWLSLTWVCGAFVRPYLVIACIFSPSSMLWDKACWLLCLLMRAKTLSWWASYSSRLG